MPYLIDNEKCPKCNEEFIQERGLNCDNRCEDKQLEEEHRLVAPQMVNHCLPNWGVNVDCPNEWREPKEGERVKWGVASAPIRKIEIPWYTLRNKKMFFPTVPHEVSHISAYEKKYNFQPKVKGVLEGLGSIIQQYYDLPPLVRNNPQIRKNYWTTASNYYLKHKKIIDEYEKEKKTSHGGHWENPWYSDYVGYHKALMKTRFAKYNYKNKPPLTYEESWD